MGSMCIYYAKLSGVRIIKSPTKVADVVLVGWSTIYNKEKCAPRRIAKQTHLHLHSLLSNEKKHTHWNSLQTTFTTKAARRARDTLKL